MTRAVASMETAVRLDPKEPRYHLELDQLYEAGGRGAGEAAGRSSRRTTPMSPGRVTTRWRGSIALLVEVGRYEDALRLLQGNSSTSGKGRAAPPCTTRMWRRTWRWATAISPRSRFREALTSTTVALDYPVNLGTGRPLRGERLPETYYYMGRAAEALGDAGHGGEALCQRGGDRAVRHPAVAARRDR